MWRPPRPSWPGPARGLTYALCRPPGHHATPLGVRRVVLPQQRGGRRASSSRRGGAQRVAVVDLDAHHGNGTQAIFYDRADVLYASVHVDPGAGWFPHVAGFADERGRGPGEGHNLNRAAAPGTGDDGWLSAVRRDPFCRR